jgi:gamma-glutamylcyclotransferase (GGCT)/AIG2-like uncharacterized protein YtfP
LKRDRLKQRIGESKQEQPAILKDFILTCAKAYDKHKSGCANIRPCPNSQVEGAIYLITENQLGRLDSYEGVGLGVYRRRAVNVEVDSELCPQAKQIDEDFKAHVKRMYRELNLSREELLEWGQ